MDKRIIIAVVVVVVLLLAYYYWSSHSGKNPYPPMKSFGASEPGNNYPGNDYTSSGYGPVSETQCQMLCSVTAGCQGYSYNPDAQICWPKNTMQGPIADSSMVSAKVLP